MFSPTEKQTNTWHWQDDHGLSYLTCSLLKNWQHGFFTRQYYPRLPEELVNILKPGASVSRLKQIHTNRVLTPTEIKSELAQLTGDEKLPPGDGIISDNPQQSVWVATADCTPVLIGDLDTNRVCAIHAGWRGTALKIVPEAISRFLHFGSKLENLRIALGPAIAGEVYQVTETVAAEVGSTLIKKSETDTLEEILKALQSFNPSPLYPDQELEKIRLDVRLVNLHQLQQLGIQPEQIAIAPYCTYQDSEQFFSYRKTQEKKVQWSGIVSY